MLGAIFGDYLGSKFEKIPGAKLRKDCSITDDSWLTFAQLDWLNNADLVKFSYLFRINKQFSNKEFAVLSEELFRSAKKFLIKWVNIGLNYSNNDIAPGFSPGMLIWVEQENNNNKSLTKRSPITNGCIMRNTPIFSIGYKKELSLEECLFLAEIFAKTTHDSEEAVLSVKKHTVLGYLVCQKKINPINFRKALLGKNLELNDDYSNIIKNIKIKTLNYWINQKKQKKFIWDAETSLDISMSAIFYSKTYDEFINFCCKTEMDTDTYAAIGGEIARILFKKEIPDYFIEYLKNFPEIKEVLSK